MPNDEATTRASTIAPLSISHLLVLTLTISLAFAYFSLPISVALNTPSDHFVGPTARKGAVKAWSISMTTREAFLAGVAMFGFAVVVREAVAQKSLRWMSLGHWYLLLTGPESLLIILTNVAMDTMRGLESPSWYEWIGAAKSLAALALGVLWLCAMVRLPKPSWRIIACLLALAEFDMALFHANKSVLNAFIRIDPIHLLGLLGTLYLCVVVTIASSYVSSRIKKYPSHDWLHYVGIAVLAFNCIGFCEAFSRILNKWGLNLYYLIMKELTGF